MIEPRKPSRLPSLRTNTGPAPIRGHSADGGSGASLGAIPSAVTPDNLVKVFWQSRWVMLLSTTLALVMGFIYVQKATPIYSSTSKLYVQQSVVSIPGLERGVVPRYNLYTQAQLLRSTIVLSAALQEQDTSRMRTFAGTDNPVAYLGRHLKVAVGKNDDIISVSLNSPDPIEAAELVNVVVDAYIEDHNKNKQTSSAELLMSFRARLDEARKEQEKQLNALTEFKKENISLAAESDQGAGVMGQQLRLENLYTDARLRTLASAAALERIKVLAEQPAALRQALNAPGAAVGERASLEASLFQKQSDRAELLQTGELTLNHPRVKLIDTQVERIETRLADFDRTFLEAVLAAAERECLEAKQNEKDLAQLLEQEQQKMANLGAQLAEYDRLRKEFQQSEEYCQTLELHLRGMNMSDDFEAQKIRVLEVARPSSRPSEPQRGRVMATALILGVMSGGAFAVLRDLLDQTLRSSDEISATLRLPVLGVVPTMSSRQNVEDRGQKVHLQPDSPEAEAFRTVRTAVFFGVPKEAAKTMLVTSPTAGDGKSTLASNLAIAMAQAGQKTILFDADFRNPTQHVIFASQGDGQGLSGVLAGRIPLARAIELTPAKGLSLLPCGPNLPNPAEILSSRRFAKVLESLANAYDRVVIDAPPVTVVTDAQILGALCGVTVLVLRAGKSTRKASQRAIDALHSTGANLLGAVVNDVRQSGDRYGYYGDYRRSHGPNGNGGRSQSSKPGTSERDSTVGLLSQKSG